jgi:hypothetical protein
MDFGFYTPAGALAGGIYGVNHNYYLEAGGDNITLSLQSGGLPTGLTINSQTGQITGVPTALDTFTFSVHITDGIDVDSREFSILVEYVLFPPVVASLVSPNNVEAMDIHNPTFVWNNSERADGYRLYFGTERGNMELLVTLSGDNYATEWLYEESLEYNTEYFWSVLPYNAAGVASGIHFVGSFKTMKDPDLSDIENVPTLITELIGNYPNPFNPTTNIRFNLANDSNVNITIYNIRGQRVTTLFNDHLERGEHSIRWHSTYDNGREVASGVYLFIMQADGVSQTSRMVLLK